MPKIPEHIRIGRLKMGENGLLQLPPELAEALALSMADNLDAKLAGVTALFDSTEETGWLGYQKMFETNMRKTSK